ncbi:hypothetical protein TNCV_1823261 [Trichonephila clavipes]|nr:hypothetical protein TNCV_1823261 [Trichonephila clavipes]
MNAIIFKKVRPFGIFRSRFEALDTKQLPSPALRSTFLSMYVSPVQTNTDNTKRYTHKNLHLHIKSSTPRSLSPHRKYSIFNVYGCEITEYPATSINERRSHSYFSSSSGFTDWEHSDEKKRQGAKATK